MPGRDAVLLWRMWTLKLAQILIILMNVVCYGNNGDAEIQAQICTSSIHDFIYDLRFKLLIKEKNIREKFQDLGEYTINGIVETKQEIENLYKAINPKYEYQIESDKHRDEIITCKKEKIQLQNKINEMHDEIRTIKEIYMNKYDYNNITIILKRLEGKLEKNNVDDVKEAEETDKSLKNMSEDIKTMTQKFEELSLKLKDFHDSTNYILGKHENLLTNLAENVNLFRETSSNDNDNNNNTNMNTDTGKETSIIKYVDERNISEENVCMKMLECRKTVEELNVLTDVNEKTEFIRNIYRNETKFVFLMILGIGDNVKNLNTRLVIYRTLFSELTNNFDLYKLLKLCKALKRNLIEQTYIDDETKNDAEKLLNSMLDELKIVTINIMREDLRYFSWHYSNRTISHNVILKEIWLFDKEFCGKIFESIVNDVYERHKSVIHDQYNKMMSLLTYIAHIDNVDLRIIGLLVFYNRVKEGNSWNDRDLLFNVLLFIKDVIHMKIENDGTVNTKSNIETNLISQLPPCYRALVSYKYFCIRNICQNGYISAISSYVGTTSENGTQPKFIIYNSTDQIPVGGEWTIEYQESSCFHIHNFVLNKYLYSSTFGDEEGNRYVSASIKGTISSTALMWFIIPEDDYCYIRSSYKEYMYVHVELNSNNTKSQDLFSLRTRGDSINKYTPSTFKWQLVDCPPPTLNSKQTE